jgi:hypothetical protein
MNYLSSFKKLSRAKQVAVLLMVSTLTWAVGVPVFFTTASAAQLASISATASSSVPSANTNYIVRYTSTSTVTVGQTITIQFSYGKSGGTDEFGLGSLVTTDINGVAGISVLSGACGGATADQVALAGGGAGIVNSAGTRTVTFVSCGTVSVGAKAFSFTNSHITNPATAGSYKVFIGGTQADTGITMVAVLSQVTVTASVDTTLTFTVAGVASGQSINGETISTTTTATAIGFGSLASGTPVIAAQDLTVTTNAQNGFIVTVHEDQNLLSSNGADIDLFQDGNAVATPIAWATPTAVLGNENTYGHIGLTSDDSDLNANEFDSGSIIKWAGNFGATSTRTIFSNTGPSDGVTQNVGKARVGYKVLVSALQEAATDYTNHLIYVCTPTF